MRCTALTWSLFKVTPLRRNPFSLKDPSRNKGVPEAVARRRGVSFFEEFFSHVLNCEDVPPCYRETSLLIKC